MKAAEIETLLADAGMYPPEGRGIILHADYALPTRDWLVAQFGPAFARNLAALRLHYSAEAFNCEGFGRLAWALSLVCYNLAAPPADKAFATGVMEYKPTSGLGKGHELFFAITGPRVQDVLFCEAQAALEETSLTEVERFSCYGYQI